MAWKYIVMAITSPGGTTWEFPVIFPDKMIHAEMFAVAKFTVPGANAEGSNVRAMSAGMIELVEVEGVGGRSDTLKLKSRGDGDAKLITLYPYTHGIT